MFSKLNLLFCAFLILMALIQTTTMGSPIDSINKSMEPNGDKSLKTKACGDTTKNGVDDNSSTTTTTGQ